MKNIRIGNDIVIKWAITIDGVKKSLEGLSLRFTLTNDYGGEIELPFAVKDNVVISKFLGIDQNETGTYGLSLWVNYGKEGQAVIDECEAFKLVHCSHITDSDDSDIVEVCIELEGDLSLPSNGLSAYEIALIHGFVGTEEEWLESLKAKVNGYNVVTLKGGSGTEVHTSADGTITITATKAEEAALLAKQEIEKADAKLTEIDAEWEREKEERIEEFSGEKQERTIEFETEKEDRKTKFKKEQNERETGFQQFIEDKTKETDDVIAHVNSEFKKIEEGANNDHNRAEQDHKRSNDDHEQAQADKLELEQIKGKVEQIENVIPSQASSENKLADKEFVNSSIATATATFRGTYDKISDFPAEGDLNDYVFHRVGDETTGQIVRYDKYKWSTNGWLFEYSLNNSSFTEAQWKALNSGATVELFNAIDESIKKKQDTITDLATIRYGANKGASALQPEDMPDNLKKLNDTAKVDEDGNVTFFGMNGIDANIVNGVGIKQGGVPISEIFDTIQNVNSKLSSKQNTLSDTDGGYGQRVKYLELNSATLAKLTEVQNFLQGQIDNSATKEELEDVDGIATNAYNTAVDAMAIAKGKSKGYVFATKEAMDEALAEHEFTDKLHMGDNLYILALDVPDYWWDGSQARELETQKVDLSAYLTAEQIATLYATKAEVSKKVERVELEYHNGETPFITYFGKSEHLSFEQIVALVSDEAKFVTLLWNTTSFLLPQYFDGAAIIFTGVSVMGGSSNAIRVAMSEDGDFHSYTMDLASVNQTNLLAELIAKKQDKDKIQSVITESNTNYPSSKAVVDYVNSMIVATINTEI